MNSKNVSNVIKMLVDERARKIGRGPINYDKIQKEVEIEATDICKVMFADYSMPVIRWFGWFLTKVFKQIYDKVVIDDTTLKMLRDHDQKNNGPLILLPTHRSYIDFLMVFYIGLNSVFICFLCISHQSTTYSNCWRFFGYGHHPLHTESIRSFLLKKVGIGRQYTV